MRDGPRAGIRDGVRDEDRMDVPDGSTGQGSTGQTRFSKARHQLFYYMDYELREQYATHHAVHLITLTTLCEKDKYRVKAGGSCRHSHDVPCSSGPEV